MPRWTLRSVAIANTATKIASARMGGGKLPEVYRING
jgi:hypothetical protein